MNDVTHWLTPSAMHSLGWTLLHFLWQGTAVAALAAVLMALCRRSSSRYALAVGSLVLMLAAPIATFFFLTSAHATSPDGFSPVAAARSTLPIAVGIGLSPSYRFASFDALPWLVEAWLFGAAFFSLRCAGGFLLLERERRRQSSAPGARVLALCHALQRRFGLHRTIRYCECRLLQGPAVIGWFRPIIMLPVTAVTGLSEEQLESIIVHELAHIRRLDSFVNVFQIAVETLLFYHPAIWWLNRRIREEREHCCDDVAVAICGNPVEYARALTLMEEWRSAPAMAMAANRGPLAKRIFRVLGVKPVGAETRGIGLAAGILCLTAALFAGHALFGMAYPAPIAHAASASNSSWPAQQSAPAAAAPKPSTTRSQTAAQPSGSYIDGMKAAGLGDFTVDQLIALKIQGVTPEYIRDLHALGLNPDADQVVAMKIQGADVGYIRGLKEAGIEPDIDQIVAMKIQGVIPQYVRDVRAQGLRPDADELVAMRIQDVTVEYIREIQALGLKPTVDEFVAMRIQGVTPEYAKDLKTAGFTLDVEGVISAKIQGVTREFIDDAVQHGFRNITLEKLIQLKQIGILASRAEI